MKVATIALKVLRRLSRQRTVAFFTLLIPLLLILLLGALFGEPEYRLGLVVEDDGPLAVELADGIRKADGLVVTDDVGRSELLDAIAHNDRDAGVIIPAGYDLALRAGDQVVLEYLATSPETEFGVGGVVEAEFSAQSGRVAATRLAAATADLDFEDGLALASQIADVTPGVEVRLEDVDGGDFRKIGSFDVFASRMMLLFVFLTAASGGSEQLIQSRDLGMSRRMLATATSPATIIGGETLGRFSIALVQSLLIVVVAALVFGVDWANWPAVLAVLVAFSLVAAASGVLIGSLFRSSQLASNVGTFVALALAIVGGLMGGVPGPVPHGWATIALDEIMVARGGFGDISNELGSLAISAFALVVLASVAFNRSLTRA